MKVTVNRQLSGGQYHVNFEVSDFAPEEVAKMSSFGIPGINIEFVNSAGRQAITVPLNQLRKLYDATFSTEEAAKKYETSVLDQIKAAMERLRQSKDDFTGSQEVEL